MKLLKKVLGSIIFIGIAVLLFVPVSYMLRSLDSNKSARMRTVGFYAEPNDSLDVVVIGSSAVYRYINNPVLWMEKGITSYNMGSQGLSIFFIEYLIDEVKKTQSPDLYIIDARKFVLTKDEKIDQRNAHVAINNMKYSLERCKMINLAFDDPMERLNYYFDIAIYHDSWENFSSENLEYVSNEREHEIKGWKVIGNVESFDRVAVENVTEEMSISEASENALRSLCDKCQEENINVLFLATPWFIDEERQKQSNYVGSIVEEYDFNYLDMNLVWDEIGLDEDADFYDLRHTNVYGTEKLTKYLAAYLEENYEIDYEHSEEVSESWDNAVVEYRNKLDELEK